MNTALLARPIAIVTQTPAANYKDHEGYLVDMADGTATLAASATVPAKGIILAGNPTSTGYASEEVSVGILGTLPGTVRMKASGSITKGARVTQAVGGTIITDAGSGGRVVVGVAIETGVSGDLIEVAPITPVALS